MSVKVYKANLARVLEILRITAPEHLAMDQLQVADLLRDIRTALETYDPLPPGDALGSDVRHGKVFSTAAALGLVGTLSYTACPAPSVSVAGTQVATVTNTGYYDNFFDAIEFYNNADEKIGEATYAEGSGWTFDLSSFLTEPGSFSFKAGYSIGPVVTLSDSALTTIPLLARGVTKTLTGCEDLVGPTVALEGLVYAGMLTLVEGFNTLPVTIDITVGGVPLVDGDYTYDNTTGVYSILPGKVTGAIVITAVATV